MPGTSWTRGQLKGCKKCTKSRTKMQLSALTIAAGHLSSVDVQNLQLAEAPNTEPPARRSANLNICPEATSRADRPSPKSRYFSAHVQGLYAPASPTCTVHGDFCMIIGLLSRKTEYRRERTRTDVRDAAFWCILVVNKYSIARRLQSYHAHHVE